MTRKTVTMSDIAKELGLSTVSVSKALSGKDGVGDAVREMIIKKAAEMGYTYTKGTKETVEKRHNIGIIVSEHFITKDAYYSRLYEKTMMKDSRFAPVMGGVATAMITDSTAAEISHIWLIGICCM